MIAIRDCGKEVIAPQEKRRKDLEGNAEVFCQLTGKGPISFSPIAT